MATYEEKVMAYLETPKDSAVLEEQHFERSAEVLQLKEYLASKGLLIDYELAMIVAEEVQANVLSINS